MELQPRHVDAPPVSAVPTHCAVFTPSRELTSCVRAYVTRSTIGANLQDLERHNLYPASLSCSISWTLRGQTELLRVGSQVVNAMARSSMVFSGPQTEPIETRNPGPVQFFLLMFLPDAFHAMTGVNLQAYTNRHTSLHEVLDVEWQRMAIDVMAAQDDSRRVQIIETFLRPRWQAARPATLPLAPQGLTDWVRHLAMRCAMSPTGKSLRQIERRVKQWTGQTQRQLIRMTRGERAYLNAREQCERGDLVWSALAVDEGFSDQSHFCREFRKLTGLQPEAVLGKFDRDERLWIYKVW